MNFSTKLAQTRLYATDNQLGVDSQEVYNEGILQSLDSLDEKLNTLINIFKGIEPSLLSGGISNLDQTNGVQIGNQAIIDEGGDILRSNVNNSEVYIRGGTDDTTIGNNGNSLLIGIKGGLSGEIADTNASKQLKTTVIP